MAIKKVSQGGGGWLKPEDHIDDVAILFEVKRIDRDRETDYGKKDSVVCDISYFATKKDLKNGVPSEIGKSVRVEFMALSSDLIDDVGVGNSTITSLGKSKPKKNRKPAFIFKEVDDDIYDAVVEYIEARDAEVEKAMDDVPDFDDDEDD